ncbi:ABC1 kinase family protein [Oryzobacter telluris]|uniref:ABC1 kinase family protein n=1 Tax=Oryzobacter telluris TaxID=3149179 RepID=UPI00370D289B
MTDIPKGSVARAAKLVGLPLGHAGRVALGVGKRVGGRPAELVAAELQARTAEQLFAVLGTLKGGAMKFGQALSVMEAAMPEDLAGPYRATLTKLQEAGPPMGADRVHEILARELGPRWATTKLVAFDDTPAASASIGQVHKAVWRDGREVAVKIQYPGAAEALLSDLNQLSRVARVAGSWVPGIDVKPIMDELKARMSEELDYHLEARNQRHFAAAFRDDDDVLVPDVLVDSDRVLVTEWVDGTPLSRIITDGTQEQRDEAATLYLEFLLRAPNVARMLHADPHPGNFRITEDGRLGVLDFGAVNRLPHGLPSSLGRVLTEALAGDAPALEQALRSEGFIRKGIEIDPDALLAYLTPLVEPLLHDEFTPTRAWLRGAAATLQDPRRPQFLIGLKLNLPPDYLLIHRVWLGGIGVLSQLGGTVPLREMVCAYLSGVDESRLPPSPD